MTSLRAPVAEAQALLREQKSRFLAIVSPVQEAREALDRVEALRRLHHDATHHCWAWRLGLPPSERAFDAGEPRGTAGTPILQVLRGAELTDVLVTVVRWFGGTKLGRGGLARAYRGATELALEGLSTIRRTLSVRLELEVPYPRLAAVKRLVHPPQVELASEDYGERVRLCLQVQAEGQAAVEGRLKDLGVQVLVVHPNGS